MLNKTFEIALNTKHQGSHQTDILVNQNDRNSVIFNFRIYDGASEINYSDVKRAMLIIESPSKNTTQLTPALRPEGGLAVTLSANAVSRAGRSIANLTLCGHEDERIVTLGFSYDVTRDLLTANIEASNEFDALLHAMALLEHAKEIADGITSHARLSHLDFADSGHVGFASHVELIERLRWRGDWAERMAVAENDIVVHGDALFRARRESSGSTSPDANNPTARERWERLTGGVLTSARIADNFVVSRMLNNVQNLDSRVTLGQGAAASGSNAVTIGNGATSGGGSAIIAIGNNSSATAGGGAIAIGTNSTAIGTGNIAIGQNSHAHYESVTMALGLSATSSGNGSNAIGRNANSTHARNVLIVPNAGTIRPTVADNQIVLGYAGITPHAFAPIVVTSDRRDKIDIRDLEYDALEFINRLKPSQYRMDFRSEYVQYREISEAEFNALTVYDRQHTVVSRDVQCIEGQEYVEWLTSSVEGSPQYKTECICDYVDSYEVALGMYREKYSNLTTVDNHPPEGDIFTPTVKTIRNARFLRIHKEQDGSQAGNRYHNGFVAQDVQAIASDMGFDFAGVKHFAHNKDKDEVPTGDDMYGIAYEELVAPMVGAIQQLYGIIKEQGKEIKRLITLVEG